MKRFILILCSVLLIVVLGAFLIAYITAMPDMEEIEADFQSNYEDIQVVVEFLENSPYESVHIDSTDGTMWADFETVDIDDKDVNGAVKRILKRPFSRNGRYYAVYMSENTIEFYQWKSSQDKGCGVAYSINQTDLPDIQYCTELVALSETGWYYYVDDCNAWRIGKRPWNMAQ